MLSIFWTTGAWFLNLYLVFQASDVKIRTSGKDFLKSVSNSLFSLYSPVVPLKTIPYTRQKWAKHTSLFQTETEQKPYPLGLHIPGAFRYTVSGARVRVKVPAPIHVNLFSQRTAEKLGTTSVVPFDTNRRQTYIFARSWQRRDGKGKWGGGGDGEQIERISLCCLSFSLL